MFAKALSIALVSGLSVFAATGRGMAVDLNTPYVPSLRPSTPPIPGNSGLDRPGPTSRGCYGSTTCCGSNTYIGSDGVLIYRNGEPLKVYPSARPPIRTFGPSSNHIQWCSNHYRSYRSSDDTYQPLAGPRQSCNSPFQ